MGTKQSARMEGVNPEILKWARTSVGMTPEIAYKNITSSVDILLSWEEGTLAPTYSQLIELAKRYGRPLALFFFPEPPDEPTAESQFRTIPQSHLTLSSDVIKIIRDGMFKQISLYELSDGINQSTKPIFKALNLNPTDNLQTAARAVRQYLGITIEAQLQWKNDSTAFNIWRTAVQDAGVFVFRAPFKQEGIDGFCLFDKEFPLIYINSSVSKNRQIFTLFHELAHVLLQNNGLTKSNIDYIDQLQGTNRLIEVFCNRFTAEFLMPQPTVYALLVETKGMSPTYIMEELATKFNVSREAAIIRLQELGYIDRALVDQIRSELKPKKPIKKKSNGGGSNITNVRSYLGTHYINLVFGQYYAGRFSFPELVNYLGKGITAKSVEKLERVHF